MASSRVKVTYDDGREVEVKITPRAQIATERHIGGDWQGMAILSMYYAAWVALSKTDPETGGFEGWLDHVEDVTTVKEEEDPDPTQPAPSNDSLSD